ncbi:MAG: thermonuclease family protein [Candidatus Omnitrophica bacterium]|nr:thermonuclease family protein [Candidatus Omnitrophota bacterium]
MPNVAVRSTYDRLIDDISGLYEGARKALVAAYWQIGQRIVEVEQDGAVKAEYGTGLVQKISDDMVRKYGAGFSLPNLKRMKKFYLRYPKGSPASQLTWSDHVELLPIANDKKRRAIEKKVLKQGLSKEELRKVVREETAGEAVVKKDRALEESLPPLKRPADLRLLTFREVTGKEAAFYRVAERDVLLDCGFFVSLAVSEKEARDATLTPKPSYVYAAKVERVVDGDTLLVVLDLGFGASVREKLRLRGINTPELGTPEGEKAKKFVAGLLPVGTPVIVKSYRTDIYGRFVVDVLYKDGATAVNEIVSVGIWLNQQLLDEGLAVRMAG